MKIIWDKIGPCDREAALMPLQQSLRYGATLERLSRTVRRATIVRDGVPVGVAQVVSRRFGPARLSLLMRGPLWSVPVTPPEEHEALRHIARTSFPLVAIPESAAKGRGLVPLVTPRHLALLDLGPDAGALRRAMHSKWRNRLVRAEAEGLKVRFGVADPGVVAALLAEDAAQQSARGYRALPARFTHAWIAADPSAALSGEVLRRGERIAAMLFLLHRPWATYHIGWSGPEGRRLNAHNLLLWEAALRLRNDGYTTLDLGDVNTEDAPGLARFKLGSGAQVRKLGPTSLVLPAFTRRRS